MKTTVGGTVKYIFNGKAVDMKVTEVHDNGIICGEAEGVAVRDVEHGTGEGNWYDEDASKKKEVTSEKDSVLSSKESGGQEIGKDNSDNLAKAN